MVTLGLGAESPPASPEKPEAWSQERCEYLYSVPQEADLEDGDFVEAWARAIEACARRRGWLVFDASALERALAHATFGPPPGLEACLFRRFRRASSLAHDAERTRRRRELSSPSAAAKFAVAAVRSRAGKG